MIVLQILSVIVRMIARTVHSLAVCGVVITQFAGRRVANARQRGAGGEPGMVRLLDLHAASCAGDTLVTIALAGTIFFGVPAGEARGKVAMYLLVTMLPFALLAPVVGPILDRFRHGRRYALATTMLGRAFLAYMISEHLGGLALYPAAFGVLVLSRAYGVARSAAVPRVLPSTLGLSEAGARASVFGTVAGAVAAPIGLGAAAFGPEWSLRLSTLVFAFGMITALRLPPRADSDPPEAVPRPLQRPGHRGAKILSGRIVVASLIGSASLRLLYGFLMLYLALAIRSEALSTSLLGRDLGQSGALGLVAGALGLGSLLATAVGTKLRIHRPAQLQAGALVLVAGAGVASAVLPGLALLSVLCLVASGANGLAKLALDAVIQERIDERVRASAFAHSETLLMTAWVVGGALGLVEFPIRWGAVVVAGLAVLAAARATRAAVSLRRERLHGAPITDTAPALPTDWGVPADSTSATGPAAAVTTPTPANAGPARPGPTRSGHAQRATADADPTRRAPADADPTRRGPAAKPTQRVPADAEPTRRVPAATEPTGPAAAEPPVAVPAAKQPAGWLGRRFGRRRGASAPVADAPPDTAPDPAATDAGPGQVPVARQAPAGRTAPPGRQTPATRQSPSATTRDEPGSGAAARMPDRSRSAADDPGDRPSDSPGFHLYRPSGLATDDDGDRS